MHPPSLGTWLRIVHCQHPLEFLPSGRALPCLLHPLISDGAAVSKGFRMFPQFEKVAAKKLLAFKHENLYLMKVVFSRPFFIFRAAKASAGKQGRIIAETLLRLLLPLNGKVQPTSSDPATRLPGSRTGRAPRASPDRSIGRSDGRCVQRAGT